MALTLSGKVEWRGKQGGVLVNTITYIDTTDYVSEGISPLDIIGILRIAHETKGVVYENTNWGAPDFTGNGSGVVSALLDGSGNFVNGEYQVEVRVRDGLNGYEYSNTIVYTLQHTPPVVFIEQTVDGYASTLKSEDSTQYGDYVVGVGYCHSITLPQGGSTACGDAIINLGAPIYAGTYTTNVLSPVVKLDGDITIYDEVVGSKSVVAYNLSKADLWSRISLLNDAYSDNLGVNPILALKQKDIVIRCNVYQEEYDNALQEGSTIRAYESLKRIYIALSPDYVPSQTVEEIPVFTITPVTLHSHSNLSVISKFSEGGGNLLYNGLPVESVGDGKVKVNALDTEGYLQEKVDTSSIRISASNKLEILPSWISGKIDSTLSYNGGTLKIGISEFYLQGRVQGDYIKFNDTTKKLYVDETALVQLINNTVGGGGGGGESLWTDILSSPTNQIGTEKSVIIGALTPTTHKLYVNGSVRIGSLNGILKASFGVVSAGALVASEIPNLDWSKITSGKPTTISGYGITDNHNFTNIPDTRDTVTTPNTYNRKLATSFKRTSTLSLSVGSTYAQVLGYRAFDDYSGGYAHELAFVNEGIYHRAGSSTTWEVGWGKLMTTSEAYTKEDINNFFSGETAITGYNKTNWDSTYTLFNDLFERKSDGQGGYYIRAKYTLASDGNIIAFTDSGQQLPSIFDSLPIASPTQLGVIKVGNTLSISNGVLNIANGIGFDLAANYSPTGQWNFTQTPKVGGVAISLSNHTHSYEPLITKTAGYAKWTGSAWTFVNESYYTQAQVNSFFAGTTAITGYNKTNWDGANALLNDLFEKKSDGQGGYYIRAKYTLASDGNIIAFTDSGQSLPSIFDNLPVASATQLGVIKVGTSLSISNGVLNVSPTYIGGVNEAEVNAIIAAKVNVANGLAGLDSGAKLPVSLFPDSMLGQVSYQGTWNASTNTPTLPTTPPAKGHYYVVSVAGTKFSIEFQVGDWIISNGTAWQKVDNSDAVMTVFGRLGNVVANATDYTSFYLRHDTASQGLTSTQKSNARVNLGATTIGASMFTLTNPSTLAYPQFNGDNTVTALSAAGMRSALDVAQKQSSVTDTTSGRGMIVGAFGLGTIGITTSLSDNSYSRLFWANTDTPASNNHMGIKMIGITGYSFDIAGRNDRFWLRTKENGTQQPWREVYHTGNANLSTVDWAAKNIRVSGNASIGKTTVESGYILDTNGSVKVNGNLVATGNVTANTLQVNGSISSSGDLSIVNSINIKGTSQGGNREIVLNRGNSTYGSTGYRDWKIKANEAASVQLLASINNVETLLFEVGDTGTVYSNRMSLNTANNWTSSNLTTQGTYHIQFSNENGLENNRKFYISQDANKLIFSSQNDDNSWKRNLITMTADGVVTLRGGNVEQLQTASNGVYIPNYLEVGSLTKTSDSIIRVLSSNNYSSGIELMGSTQGSGYVYVGQSNTFGGGMIYQGDDTPALMTGSVRDTVTFYRNNGGSNEAVFYYGYGSNNVIFRGNITSKGDILADGNIVATGGVTALSASDMRLKTDIKPISNALDIIASVRPITHKWNKKAQDVNKALDVTKTNYGVIAQELKTILPDLVGGMYDGKYLGVNYEQLISILIAAVQELNKKMEGITCR